MDEIEDDKQVVVVLAPKVEVVVSIPGPVVCEEVEIEEVDVFETSTGLSTLDELEL